MFILHKVPEIIILHIFGKFYFAQISGNVNQAILSYMDLIVDFIMYRYIRWRFWIECTIKER